MVRCCTYLGRCLLQPQLLSSLAANAHSASDNTVHELAAAGMLTLQACHELHGMATIATRQTKSNLTGIPAPILAFLGLRYWHT